MSTTTRVVIRTRNGNRYTLRFDDQTNINILDWADNNILNREQAEDPNSDFLFVSTQESAETRIRKSEIEAWWIEGMPVMAVR